MRVAVHSAGMRSRRPVAVIPATLPMARAYCTGISSAVPISLEMVALKRLPQETFGIMTSMEPAVAALLGLLMLNEHLSGLQWLAIGFIMLAAAGSSVTARRDMPKSALAEVVM